MTEQENESQEKAIVKKKKRGSNKYSYSFGDIYPGVRLGHRDCNPFRNLPWLISGGPYGVILGFGHGNAHGDAQGGRGPSLNGNSGGGYRATSVYAGGPGSSYGAPGYGGMSVYGGTTGYEGGPGGALGGYGGQGHIAGVPPGGVLFNSRGGLNGANLVPPKTLGQVPPNMGWLWNAPDATGKKHPRGWQPGAIGKSMAKVMTFKISRGAGRDIRKDKKKKKGKRRQGGDKSVGEAEESEPEEELEPKPALKVQRKGDMFTIQVNPLKDLSEIGPLDDPYVDCDPIVFKIIKKRSPEEQAKVEARKLIRLKKQRDAEIRKALSEATEDICKCAYMDVYCNDLTAIDKVIEKCPAFKEPECLCKDDSLSSLSSNASWDIEYTPPFGCFDLSPRKAKNYIHVETQYCPVDAGVKPVEGPNGPKLPKKISNSLKPSKCKKRVSKGCTCCNSLLN